MWHYSLHPLYILLQLPENDSSINPCPGHEILFKIIFQIFFLPENGNKFCKILNHCLVLEVQVVIHQCIVMAIAD